MDEVIGVNGSCNGSVLFVNDLVLPDIPVAEFKKALMRFMLLLFQTSIQVQRCF